MPVICNYKININYVQYVHHSVILGYNLGNLVCMLPGFWDIYGSMNNISYSHLGAILNCRIWISQWEYPSGYVL
jgi:hypothetical protein